MENKKEVKKIAVDDAAKLDEKIPRGLIIMYDKNPYITKAGLEWKANKLYGAGGYSLEVEPHTVDFEKNIFIFKATMTYHRTGSKWVNYGYATLQNTNSMMQKQLLHLAITRAECRVLRMSTACGYASYDEVVTQNVKHVEILPEADTDGLAATEAQRETIAQLGGGQFLSEDTTQREARNLINELNENGRGTV